MADTTEHSTGTVGAGESPNVTGDVGDVREEVASEFTEELAEEIEEEIEAEERAGAWPGEPTSKLAPGEEYEMEAERAAGARIVAEEMALEES